MSSEELAASFSALSVELANPAVIAALLNDFQIGRPVTKRDLTNVHGQMAALQNGNFDSNSTMNEIVKFFKWNLKAGEGDLGYKKDGFANIDIPKDNLIYDVSDHVANIVKVLNPSIADNFTYI